MPSAPTRVRILETAARLFHERGYHATGVATIQREAGVNPGTLYHFFPSKEDLLRAVLERHLELLRSEVTDPAEARSDDPLGRVFALLHLYRYGLELTGCKQGCPLGNLALEVSDAHPGVRALLDANFQGWLDVVEGWLVEAGERLPPEHDRRRLAAFVLTVLVGGILLARARGTPEPLDRAVEQLRDYFDLLEARARP